MTDYRAAAIPPGNPRRCGDRVVANWPQRPATPPQVIGSGLPAAGPEPCFGVLGEVFVPCVAPTDESTRGSMPGRDERRGRKSGPHHPAPHRAHRLARLAELPGVHHPLGFLQR